MNTSSRRTFLRRTTQGMAVGAGTFALTANAEPTDASGQLGDYGLLLAQESGDERAKAAVLKPTEDNILGPYYRKGAPYRAKITPPLLPGMPLLIRGRVWGHDSRQPLTGAVLDIWQANKDGRYDNDDPQKPPKVGVFVNRARLISDEQGGYEFETIHPGRYQIGENRWRPAHIHYLVRHPGYKTLVTQLYFHGDPMNAKDQFIKPSLIIELGTKKTPHGSYETGVFDIVLSKA